jgi:hypothetical protein
MRKKIYGITVATPQNPKKIVPSGIVKTVNGVAPDENGNANVEGGSGGNGGGLNSTASALLITILKNAVYTADQSANITALEAALAEGGGGSSGGTGGGDSGEDEAILTSISATYTGGNVEAGTAVTDLTGIVVTAHYSDGSTETVTGYTLSGTIAEGENTVTVSYGGKTTSFAVTGVAESGGDETHTHSYTEAITKEATCTADGVKTFTCECGHSYTESISATGHNYVDGVCTVCGAADPDYVPEAPAVEYGLHHDAGYKGKLSTGLKTNLTTDPIGIDKIIFDFEIHTSAMPSNRHTLATYNGVNMFLCCNAAGQWSFNNSTDLVTADKEPAQVLGCGRTTVTFELGEYAEAWNGEWGILIGGNGSETPEITWYGVKFYSGDTLKADLKPTENVGEMHDSVNNTNHTFSVTDGLTLTTGGDE